MILAVDTATKAFSLALHHRRLAASLELVHELARSRNIVGAVDFLLKSVGAGAREIEAVYAGTGPGSFTGIRIGLAFANTLLQAAGVPLLGIPSLDLLAFEARGWYNSAVSCIRSRKGEAYAAFYRGGKRESEYLALATEDLLRWVGGLRPECLVCDEDDWEELGFGRSGVKPVFGFPRASNAFLLAGERSLVPGRRYLEPLYVRDSHAVPHLHG